MSTDSAKFKSRIGCSSISFRHLPLPQALDKIQALEFRALDIGVLPNFCPHIDLRQWTESDTTALAERLAERKLRLSSFNVNLAGLAFCHEGEALAFLETTVRLAARLGARTITLPVPPATAKEKWLAVAQGLAQQLRHLAEIGQQAGLRISLEAPHTGTLAPDYEQSARLFAVVNDPRIGCTFDTSHAQLNDPRPVAEGVKAVGAEIVHVHLRDVFDGSYGVTPGKGICDYVPFFQALEKCGYTGDFNLELECSPAETETEVHFARGYLETVLAGNALPPHYAAWRSPRRRLLMRIQKIAHHPKAYITSRHWYRPLRPVARPVVKIARALKRGTYYRYESGWRKRRLAGGDVAVKIRRRLFRSTSEGKVKRVAILGCGTIGSQMHGPAFANLPGVQIVGVCDTKTELATASGKALDCPAFTAVAELVNQTKPDLVANCTVDAAHGATSLYLFDRGVDVFCEKIMAESLATGELMVRRAEALHRVLAVNLNWRFQPGILKIRQIKDAGTLGELCLLRFVCHAHVWHHVLDLVNFLGGKTVTITAQSRLDPLFQDRRPWRRFADQLLYLPGVYANALLETSEGVGATITCSNLWTPTGYLLNLDAVFRRGVISLSGVSAYDALGTLSSDQNNADLRLPPGTSGGISNYSILFERSINAFFDAYVHNQRPPTTGEDGLFTMRMEQAVVESAKTGRTVRL